MTRHPFAWLLALGLLLAAAAGAQEIPQMPLTPAPLDPVKSAERLATRRLSLEEERATLERNRQEVRALAADQPRLIGELKQTAVTEAQVEQARVDASSARLRQEDLRVDTANSERRIKAMEQTVRDFETREQLLKNPAQNGTAGVVDRTAELEATRREIEQQRAELVLERQHLEYLQGLIESHGQRLALAQQWLAAVQDAYRQQQDVTRREAQVDLEQRLQRAQQAETDKVTALAERLERERERLPEASRKLLETGIQAASERAKLLAQEIRIARIDTEIAQLRTLSELSGMSSRELAEGADKVRSLHATLDSTRVLLERKVELLREQARVIERREEGGAGDARARAEELKLVAGLGEEIAAQARIVEERLKRTDELAATLERQLKDSLRKDLFDRRELPSTVEGWRVLAEKLAGVPKLFVIQVQLSVETLARSLWRADALALAELLAGAAALAWWAVWARRRAIASIRRNRDGERFAQQVARVVMGLVRRNAVGLACALALLAMVWRLAVPPPGSGILVTLALIGAGIKLPIDLAWMLLGAPTVKAERRRPQLFAGLTATLLLGAVLAALTLIAHRIALSAQLIDLFDRAFMVYLLLVFVPVLRIRRLVLDSLVEAEQTKRYWFLTLSLVSLLLPVSLLAAAVLGLAGYVNLAWRVAWYLLVFTAILIGWLLARGLLGDGVRYAKEYAVTRLGFGQLFTEEIVDPFHRIFNVLLLLAAAAAAVQALGMTEEAALTETFWSLIERPLFSFGGVSVTLFGVAATVLGGALILWFGQWTRAVSYRWVYATVGDTGVRNSLSVFTQYFVVVAGFLVALNVLGLDLTTFTVFAGAVGVGIGLGLQSIANNFLSGLLLLIERPLRAGDVVRIGDSEGEIQRIGMRSLTMKTFDNMDVIIPNADVISNAFTNWTHSDNVLRTVMYLNVAYDSDPRRALDVMNGVINLHAAVLRDPPARALMWAYLDGGIQFRVQYFIDLSRSDLLDVRSEINLAIWDGLRKAGVRVGFPRRDLYLKEWPETLPAAADIPPAPDQAQASQPRA